MQRNKYLDNLGIPIKKYGTNWLGDDDPREDTCWKQQREEYGFDDRETWNLDCLFVEWLYSHLMMYKEVCCVDLTFHKFMFMDKEYTQEEAIDFILDICKEYIITLDEVSYTDKETELMEKVRNAIRMFAEIHPAMWW